MNEGVLAAMQEFNHEQVVFCQAKDVGLKAIIAIHDTTLGPALGGTRMWSYASETEALKDVLRLSRGMTYKAAAAGLPLGGGKAVIIGDPKKDKSQALFRSYGRFVNSLDGRYITAEDVGTNVFDMECALLETDFVTGTDPCHGGSGDPSPYTALGTFYGIKACLSKVFGDDSFKGRTFAVQGVGAVGAHLVGHLVKNGAKVIACDIDKDKLAAVKKEFSIETVPPEDIYKVKCDVFSPCALGAVINDKTIEYLQCKIVAGGANNQLERLDHADALKKRGICYAPDYVINAGGLMNVFLELEGYSRERCERMVQNIYHNVARVLKIADEMGVTTARAADVMVEQHLEKVRSSKGMFTMHPKHVLRNVHRRR
jgi:leucine dehydrogenase